jgi:predicted nucleic acid-binding protein
MTMAVFVDSTTLLYTQDLRYPEKQKRATAWLKSLLTSNQLVLSLQVLNETYAVVRRKPEFSHWRSEVRPFLLDSLGWATPAPTGETLAEAWRLEDRYRVSFWDALLLASANAASCDYFLSEDLNDGQAYGRVTAINPFRHSDIDVLGPPVSS